MVLDIMLGFLLFAGALNIDIQKLRREMKPVMILSTIGVILSTAVFGLFVPLAVVAGLFMSNRSINSDVKEHSHEALEKFWKLVDGVLNTILSYAWFTND
jgi:NhaP-type Na+/H+ or K+/H+ antiporter